METRALQTAVEWMKLCPVCRRETIHRADQDCELGLIAHCTRCGREILSTLPVILRVAGGRDRKAPCLFELPDRKGVLSPSSGSSPAQIG